MEKKIFAFVIFLCFFSLTAFGQQPLGFDQIQKETEDIRKQAEKMQQRELEQLKKTNPKLYEERRAAIDRQSKIEDITLAFHAKKISESSAESQLYPLVKQDMKDKIDNLDKEISNLEKKLQFLKKAKLNPDLLIKKRIDELLGRVIIGADEIMY